MYSVFCGSSARQSAAVDDDMTSAVVMGRRADSVAAGWAAPGACAPGAAVACTAIKASAKRTDAEMIFDAEVAFTFTPPP